jgi:2-furoyl-CoA dehydrogenase FAD binding subunit
VLALHGSDVRVIAGGQSLGAMLNMRIVTPSILLDINRVPALDVVDTSRTVRSGAMVRQADALRNPAICREVPLLSYALPHVGHYQTRNRGTLGGSVAHADPSAEIPLVLATLDGEVELRSARRTRRVRSVDFFRSALVTVREPDELVTALYWPRATTQQRFAFLEFAVREGDFAVVAVACIVENARVRLGFGGCGEVPQIVDFSVDPVSIDIGGIAQAAAARLDYRSDLLASAEYRRSLSRVLAGQAMTKALYREALDA